jgi:hypothetical protein
MLIPLKLGQRLVAVDGRRRLTLLGLADFDSRDAAIMAED